MRSRASLPLETRFDVESIHFEKRLQILSNARFVVHYQNFFFVSHRFS